MISDIESKISPKKDKALLSWPDQEGLQPISIFIIHYYINKGKAFPVTNFMSRIN